MRLEPDTSGSRGGVTMAVTGPIATVTISGPTRHNILTRDILNDLTEATTLLTANTSVTVMVLTGDGKHFSAGLDIPVLEANIGSPFLDAVTALARFPGSTIAAVRGSCIGAGVGLAVACDLRIAAEGARFGVTAARLGVLYPAKTMESLVDLIGVGAAKHLLLTGDLIDSLTAHRWGLVTEVVNEDALDERIGVLGAGIASRSAYSVIGSKRMIDAIARGDDASFVEADWSRSPSSALDSNVGRRAFLEKSQPTFTWGRG
ncbi:enoyl-CoA hydratase/isomerase family protein [Herbiconiux sp. CPCC 203407]|uniref:Enoyl-CoA hydratase/isomerase family protein n=1 Tax=Herbiconiux oxytropis TaxID=2970915 RepID=A0AA41XHZ5_9MICO|nr:enoyl-CoA hydratase/isomerase family protein [Herbiconiux oxytropis]MCS5721684.1 enoyl-CoA hydratase/isomerase family protein [Herbiconiux oxytropis]MCS5726689.1 enoyl-CoA hydratase/isomerase family protein [Herbiconiux oxytropis]